MWRIKFGHLQHIFLIKLDFGKISIPFLNNNPAGTTRRKAPALTGQINPQLFGSLKKGILRRDIPAFPRGFKYYVRHFTRP